MKMFTLIALMFVGTAFAQDGLPTFEWREAEVSADDLRQTFIEESDLIDPFSAQFRKLYQRVDDPQTICGELNAKNSVGGYIGWTPFVINGDTILVGRAGEDSLANMLGISALCRGIP